MKAKDSGESRRRKIEIAAYHLAEQRHFAPGHEDADWLAAEALVERESVAADTADRPAESATPKAPKAAKPAKVAKPTDGAAPAAVPKVTKSRSKRPPATP